MAKQTFDILHEGKGFVVVDKPEGFHVHAPENPNIKVSKDKILLQQLRDQLGQKIYPVHRLDVPTSGCLIVALDSATASNLGKQLQSEKIKKVYWAVVRGWTPDDLEIGIPLESEDGSKLLEAFSVLRSFKKIHFNEQVGIKFPTARYSLVQLEPLTGRFHQLRRHMNRISHPIIGDVAHGDRHHNRFFAQRFALKGLCLRAMKVSFDDPAGKTERLMVSAPVDQKWQKILNLFELKML